MKTEKLYDIDSHLKEFNANVLECEEYNEKWAVVLDKTAFFPEGGGQRSDKGSLDNATVSDVQINNGKIYHIVDFPLPVGQAVTGLIDFERRFDFMQQHSGEHIISGVANRLFGCENVGFHLSEDIVTLDFDKALTKEEISKIEELSNQKIFENAAFNTYYLKEYELEGLEYRSKKELSGDIRIVEIENTDRCACCAPHVKFAGEIGIIKILSSESLRGGVRLQIKCGRRALNDYCDKHNSVAQISAFLCVRQEEAVSAVKNQAEILKQAQFKINGMRRKELISLAESFTTDKKITASFIEDLAIKDLQELSDAIYKRIGGIRAVLSQREEGFNFAICGEEAEVNRIFADFKASFIVKGGGRNGLVQGTVIAEKEKIEKFFNTN